jgi:hypothetical protein
MTLTAQELDRTVAYFEKYVSRAEGFLEDLKCEVCCDRYRSCGYSCKRHYLCRECHAKVALCPFCRAPQLGVYPDLWYCGGSSFDFKPLTEAVVRNGISSTANAARFSSPTDYAFWFRSACEAGVTQLGTFENHPSSMKMVLRVVADCVNRRSNYPNLRLAQAAAPALRRGPLEDHPGRDPCQDPGKPNPGARSSQAPQEEPPDAPEEDQGDRRHRRGSSTALRELI